MRDADTTAWVFPGDQLFALKATHGFPLEMALSRIMVEERYPVSWGSFIEAARTNGWWDFQTYECIETALQDAEIPKETQEAILLRCRYYMLLRPLKR